MSSMSLTFGGSIIGISYSQMNNVKRSLMRENDILKSAENKMSSAKVKVQVDRDSSSIRLSEVRLS